MSNLLPFLQAWLIKANPNDTIKRFISDEEIQKTQFAHRKSHRGPTKLTDYQRHYLAGKFVENKSPADVEMFDIAEKLELDYEVVFIIIFLV